MSKMKLPSIIKTISKDLKAIDAKAIVVGGSVRDYYLKLPIKDYDIEVYGLENMQSLEKILSIYGSVNLVGKSFGVLKFWYEGDEYDFSFPRRESKIGDGHRGFDVRVDGSMDFKEASRRRDFSINAMGYDIEKEKFLDFYSGLEDIESKILRHIDEKTFVEDPLRIYRAVQFCARFGFTLADATLLLCKEMVDANLLDTLPKERVYTELTKLLLKASKPSVGFELMREIGILRYFPELKALIGLPQSPKFHPEGDVWVHTMMCVDAMVGLLGGNEKTDLIFMFAILCHDLGKASTTTVDEAGNIRAIGHEREGVELSESFMLRLTNEQEIIKRVLPLVEHHLKPSQFYSAKSKKRAIRRLATKVNIRELVTIAKADFLGRTTKESLNGIYDAGEWLLEMSKELKVDTKPLDNLLKGRDLIALGLKPSPKFKEILDDVYELQMDGTIVEFQDAISYVESKYFICYLDVVICYFH